MYQPTEIIFAPTARCNLACAHCRVSRGPEELGVEEARAFLRDSVAGGVERVGFSGGEPFLRPEFLAAIAEEALGLGLLFDRLMTNGVWWKDEAALRSTLALLEAAGFDGRVGLSFDAWHGQEPEKAALFLLALFEVFGRRDMAEIVSVEAPGEGSPPALLLKLAERLGAELILEEGRPVAIVEKGNRAQAGSARPSSGREALLDGAALEIPIQRLPYSAAGEPGATDAVGGDAVGGAMGGSAWGTGPWFEDDYCEGPGQLLYVHPDGSVAVCCGFGNENEALKLGRIGEGFSTLMARARSSAPVKACYETGLGELRKRLEAEGQTFPGSTRDQCFFCDYLCRKGLLG